MGYTALRQGICLACAGFWPRRGPDDNRNVEGSQGPGDAHLHPPALESEVRPPNPNGGLAPALNIYRAQGHLRLDAKTYEKYCRICPWGIVMATEMIIDHWNPDKKKWRYETHCYGPKDCEHYCPGRARVVQSRKPEHKWIDDDFERATEER